MGQAQNYLVIGNDIRPIVSKGMGVQEILEDQASKTYTAGKHFVGNDGYIYIADTTIQQGDTLYPSGVNKNCTRTDLVTEIEKKVDAVAVAGFANKTDIAPVEDESTIQKSGGYAIGEQFYHNGTLYTAKTAIAASTAWNNLVLNTNYEASDNLTDQLGDKADSSALNGKVDNSEIAPIEDSSTIQKTGGYAIGEMFYHGGALYKAKTVIAANTAWTNLTLNTNYEAAVVSSCVQALANLTADIKSDINDTFVLFDQHTHSFAVTGTNWAEALEALGQHLLDFIQGRPDEVYIEICDLRLKGLGISFTIPQHKFYHNDDTSVTFPFFGMSAAQSSAYIYTGMVWSGTVANNKLVRTWLRDNQYPVSEVMDFTSLVPGPSFNFDMRIWRKISIA